MFGIKKLLLIDGLTFILGKTQDDTLRIAIYLPEFCRIPKPDHITDYSKAESTGVTPQLSLLLFHFVAFQRNHNSVVEH